MPFQNLEEIKKANRQITDGKSTIWNARLDALAKTGDVKGFLDHLGTVASNGNCTCNCGARLGFDEVINPAATTIKK